MQQDTRDENHQQESKRRRRHRRRIRKENAATSTIKDVAMTEAEQRDNETDRMQEGVGIDSDEAVAVSKLPLGYFSLLPQSLVDHIMSFAPRETKVLLRGVCNTFRDLFFANHIEYKWEKIVNKHIKVYKRFNRDTRTYEIVDDHKILVNDPLRMPAMLDSLRALEEKAAPLLNNIIPYCLDDNQYVRYVIKHENIARASISNSCAKCSC